MLPFQHKSKHNIVKKLKLLQVVIPIILIQLVESFPSFDNDANEVRCTFSSQVVRDLSNQEAVAIVQPRGNQSVHF